MNPCARALPEYDRFDQIVLAGLEPREQPISAFGLFGGALDDAANQKELWIMASMQFGIDGLHANAPIAENGIPARSPACRRANRFI
jgi:hypothetical protein